MVTSSSSHEDLDEELNHDRRRFLVVPTAELRCFDGGHFVLDEYAAAIAAAIIETFS